MSRKHKKRLARIIIAAVTLAVITILPIEDKIKAVLFLFPYLIVGWDVLWSAVRNIVHGQVFDENFLMSLATVGAYALGDYVEAAAVMLFYQVGELFQSKIGRAHV